MLSIHEYLKYNNVALIDPTLDFHASCMKQYQAKGYLSKGQLIDLREWAHSNEAIARLTAQTPNKPVSDFSTPFDEPAPVAKKNRWTDEEDAELSEFLKNEPTEKELLNEFTDRTIASLRSRIYKVGGFYRKGKFYLA